MVRLREIPRTATFTWSPGSTAPFIATGTRAGAVDADFSNETFLELWDLDLDNDKLGAELEPVAKISTDSGFHDIAWAESEDHNRGVIAGALENGSLDLWDADKLLSGASDALISRASKHSGPIKTLQFNPRHSNLLATGGGKGELFISDLNNLDHPFRLGSAAARVDDIECLDWNKKVPHILVTGSSAGFVTVWDVKTKKESLTLNNLGRKAVSAVAWDPEKPTKLITSIPLETDPLILVWDLRNSNAPERVLRGHESGVLSLSWCTQDPDLLLSCGKDNRTICWNPQTGNAYGEFPVVTNWTFQTRWNPHNPNMFATASFDGKIAIQTIQNTRRDAPQSGNNQEQAVNDEDFFAKAQTQPQTSTFSLPKAPKWLERPVTASFGFGGRVVSVGLAPGGRASKIRISHFDIDSSVGSSTENFENALKTGNLRGICESRIADSHNDEEKTDWKVIETLLSDNPRKQLVTYLGFSSEVDEAADSLSKLGLSKEVNGDDQLSTKSEGTRKHKRITSIFDGNVEGESFINEITSSKGAKTYNPFQIYTGSESEADRAITRALLLGQFDKALEVCLQEDRMSDAFMIAVCGGKKCIEKAQEAYFSKRSEGPSYVRLLGSVVGKNLWDIVHNADLVNWKEAIAAICTFADDKEFPDLCEALGDRLEESYRSQDSKQARKDASLCYLASSRLEKLVSIWIQDLKESEADRIQNATDDTSFSIHVRALQSFIEKVTIFRHVSKFEDSERQKPSDWKLSSLYDKYLEYAEVVASHGRLDVAERYLDLLPMSYPEAEVARSRIQFATKKAAPKVTAGRAPAPRQPPTTASTFQPVQTPIHHGPAQVTANPYAPPMVSKPANPYAPAASATNYPSTGGATTYTPTSGYQPPQPRQGTVMPPPQPLAPPIQGGSAGLAPPPRASTQSPSTAAPYTRAANIPAWNDLPEGFARTPTPRRSTPVANAPVISSPFPNQAPVDQSGSQMPPISSAMSAPRGSAPLPPPPKGPAPPPRMTSPSTASVPHGLHLGERPPSRTTVYSPPSQQMGPGPALPPPVPRGPSPYNAPPTAPPPANRYAPAQPSQAAIQPHGQPPIASQPSMPPPRGPYAPQPLQQVPAQSPYAPSGGPVAQVPHPPTSQQGSRPGTSQSQKKAPPAPKYPPGDRSHIPTNAQPIYNILSADMQRVKARAPGSFKAQVTDTERRLNILFDHLNNEDLLKPSTIESMAELAHAIQVKDYETAQAIHLDILTNRTDECGNWMVGVKRLIGMSRATP
ncbi:protein transport protein S31 [Emydomyces testavorans]|uniref:Protein transport protein SEC31 n=1 Tax=Emydomyces testavorans TaxID=2070801 RepID=A0AAF0DER5_9EURO|nr:protein transport protein S31 [Emydomyces testavorans]